MDSLTTFIKNAPSEQLLTFVAALFVWVIGGYFLKKKLRQRLNSELNKNIELEDIRFEDIQAKEWALFAMLSFVFISLLIVAIFLPDLFV